jgi:hypothetical protein
MVRDACGAENVVAGALSRSELSDFVPKGLQDSARGFNPWKPVNLAPRPEGAEAIYKRRSVWSTSLHLRQRFCRPFRAGGFLNQHLGLKPQAESSCPFRASTGSSPFTFHCSPFTFFR